ncbi:MAG: hypothetical protein HRS50_01210 [Mycoplasmataceae bacterium]|nr:hypothetical protein [Mycoplasmataceae bacterium]
MIKKIIWTIIIICPIAFAGLASSLGVSDDLQGMFNSSNALGSWKSFIIECIDLSKENGNWGTMIIFLILSLFWTAPFWYAWKGTFIIGWVPIVGFFLRIGLLSILFFIPLIPFDPIQDNSIYFSLVIVILALLGLWIKS